MDPASFNMTAIGGNIVEIPASNQKPNRETEGNQRVQNLACRVFKACVLFGITAAGVTLSAIAITVTAGTLHTLAIVALIISSIALLSFVIYYGWKCKTKAPPPQIPSENTTRPPVTPPVVTATEIRNEAALKISVIKPPKTQSQRDTKTASSENIVHHNYLEKPRASVYAKELNAGQVEKVKASVSREQIRKTKLRIIKQLGFYNNKIQNVDVMNLVATKFYYGFDSTLKAPHNGVNIDFALQWYHLAAINGHEEAQKIRQHIMQEMIKANVLLNTYPDPATPAETMDFAYTAYDAQLPRISVILFETLLERNEVPKDRRLELMNWIVTEYSVGEMNPSSKKNFTYWYGLYKCQRDRVIYWDDKIVTESEDCEVIFKTAQKYHEGFLFQGKQLWDIPFAEKCYKLAAEKGSLDALQQLERLNKEFNHVENVEGWQKKTNTKPIRLLPAATLSKAQQKDTKFFSYVTKDYSLTWPHKKMANQQIKS